MTPEQIYLTARAAGFPIYAAQTATAIALAESSGNPAALGDTTITNATWGPSVGLMQVRSLNSEKGTGKSRDATKLTDPLFNMKAAYAISGSGLNWTPWTTYTKGTYKKFSATAIGARLATDPQLNKQLAMKEPWVNILLKAGVSAVPGGAAAWDGADGVAGAIAQNVGDPIAAAKAGLALVAKAGAWMGDSHNWARVAMVVAGSAGVLAGLAMLARAGAGPVSTIAAVPGKAAKAAASVVPVGRVAKVAGTAAKAAKAAKK